MDADLQHDENLLPRMLAELRAGADLVVGSRYAHGGSTGALAPGRVQMSRAATWLSRHVLARPLSDPMSGFFMMRRAAFESVVHSLSGKGFKLLLDVAASAPPSLRIVELPYDMRARRAGASKIDLMALWEYALVMADKTLGRYVPVRFVLFILVGLTGVGVHLAALALLYRAAGADFRLAQASATFVAMTTNFTFNNLFTYADRRLRGTAFLRGLLSFYVACALGALINVSLAGFLFSHRVPWWFAGVIGAAAGAVWNYAVTATFTWKSPARLPRRKVGEPDRLERERTGSND
jgi:dolichol-phosphate mannosyltransferase